MTTDPATTIDAAMLSMHSDPARNDALTILGTLLANADLDTRDVIMFKLGKRPKGRLREEFLVTPDGELVSAHRTAL